MSEPYSRHEVGASEDQHARALALGLARLLGEQIGRPPYPSEAFIRRYSGRDAPQPTGPTHDLLVCLIPRHLAVQVLASIHALARSQNVRNRERGKEED